jgi:hypothetical protein
VDFKLMAKSLYTLSELENGRITSATADPRNIGEFNSLNEVIAHSLREPNLIRTQTQAGTPLKEPKYENRPFEDEAILKKLLQYRSQIPVSARIIRPKILPEANEP